MTPRTLILADTMNVGGAERVLIDLLRRVLPDQPVDLCFFRLNGLLTAELPHTMTAFSLYPPEGKSLAQRILYNTPLRHNYQQRRLRQILAGRKYHTVISWLEGPAAVMHSYLLDSFAHARHLTWVHTDMTDNHWTLPFFGSEHREHGFYRRVNRIVFVSGQARHGFPYSVDTPMEVIPNLIDRKRITDLSEQSAPIRHRRFTLLFLGRLETVKRPDRFVDTVAELTRRGYDVEGWVIGDGRMRGQVERQVEHLRLSGRIHMLGLQTNPYPTLAQADVLVLPSDAEGLPTVVSEALTLGVPVVATRCGGVEELLARGGGITTGLTASALADAVGSLIDDPKLRDTLKTQARHAGNISATTTAQRLKSLLITQHEN